MSEPLAIEFASLKAPLQHVAALLCADKLALGPQTRALNGKANGAILGAAEAVDRKSVV